MRSREIRPTNSHCTNAYQYATEVISYVPFNIAIKNIIKQIFDHLHRMYSDNLDVHNHGAL